MKNIINLRDQLENAINEEVEFQFKKALRECETLGELRTFEPERINVPVSSDDDYSRLLFRDISSAINYEIKHKFTKMIEMHIDIISLNK